MISKKFTEYIGLSISFIFGLFLIISSIPFPGQLVTTGIVVYEGTNSGLRRTNSEIRVKFKDISGTERIFTENSTLHLTKPSIAQTVRVSYEPNDPLNAKVVYASYPLIVGISFLIAGFLIWFFETRRL